MTRRVPPTTFSCPTCERPGIVVLARAWCRNGSCPEFHFTWDGKRWVRVPLGGPAGL